MRITTLEISAFGPFKDLNTIDFSIINPKQIFLVSGPTGSGKTTIFDAISFALYGKASGSTRSDMENVRSDFADRDTNTFVTMEFQINNKDYYIKRAPKQERKKRNSEETTMKPHQVEFYELNNPDQVYTKVNEVNEQIINLLGITYEQFRQIVMLPQGEFQKLLNAKSEERTEIFRKIFNTYFYDTLQKELKTKSDVLKKQADLLKETLNIYFEHIICDENSELEGRLNGPDREPIEVLELLLTDNKLKKVILDNEIEKSKNLQTTQKRELEALNNIVLINSYIKTYKDTVELLSRVKLKKTEIDKYRSNIVKIKSAQEIEVFEQNVKDQTIQIVEAKKKNDILAKSISTNQTLFQKAQTDFLTIEEIKGTLFTLESKKLATTTLLDNLSKQKGIDDDILKSEAIISACNSKVNGLEQKSIEIKTKITAFDAKIEQSTIYINENANAKVELLQNQQIMKNYIDLQRQIKQYHSKQARYKSDYTEFETYGRSFSIQEETFRSHTNDYYKSQAGILATTLTPNKECPVCGSKSHPNKAVDSILLTPEKYKALEESYNEKRDQYNTKKLHLENAATELTNLKENLIGQCLEYGFVYNEKLLDSLQVKQQKVEERILHKKAIIDEVEKQNTLINKSKIDKSNLDLSLVTNEGIHQVELDAINTQKGIVSSLQIQLEKILELIPIEHASIEELKVRLSHIEMERKSNEQLIITITTSYNDSKLTLSSLEASRKTAEGNLSISNKGLEKATLIFNEKWSCSFETKKEYKEYLNQKTNLSKQEHSVKTYDENVLRFSQTISDLKKQIADREYVDVTPLQVALDVMQQQIQELQTVMNDHRLTLSNNENSYTQIETTFIKSKVLLKEFNDVNEIALLARGMKGNKISFERYVLAHYFNQILSEANKKLGVMTNERYTLHRKNEKTKGAAQQGLDLVVNDSHTSKSRDVSTLSGGESFKAALALALGLAEIIQQNSGGVNLETMFIDEGFGTLDSESLDMAIEVLMNINQAGRVLGIISHVQELKTRIETKIELSIINEGSVINFLNV